MRRTCARSSNPRLPFYAREIPRRGTLVVVLRRELLARTYEGGGVLRGLGLAVTRDLARDAHRGGDVSACSKVGPGSCFTIRLPMAEGQS